MTDILLIRLDFVRWAGYENGKLIIQFDVDKTAVIPTDEEIAMQFLDTMAKTFSDRGEVLSRFENRK